MKSPHSTTELTIEATIPSIELQIFYFFMCILIPISAS